MQMVPPSENHNERFNLLRVFLDFFTLTRFFYLIKPASSWVANREKVIPRSRRFYQQIQNKRGIVSKETEALCRRGLLQNKSGFIDWVHSENGQHREILRLKFWVLALHQSSSQLSWLSPWNCQRISSFVSWKHLSRASFPQTYETFTDSFRRKATATSDVKNCFPSQKV